MLVLERGSLCLLAGGSVVDTMFLLLTRDPTYLRCRALSSLKLNHFTELCPACDLDYATILFRHACNCCQLLSTHDRRVFYGSNWSLSFQKALVWSVWRILSSTLITTSLLLISDSRCNRCCRPPPGGARSVRTICWRQRYSHSLLCHTQQLFVMLKIEAGRLRYWTCTRRGHHIDATPRYHKTEDSTTVLSFTDW